jgi:hypothetical protein
MKRSLPIAVLAITFLAQNSQAQYQAGVGYYGGMQSCPYNQGMAPGAFSMSDGLTDDQRELKEIPGKEKEITNKLKEDDKLITDLEAAIGTVIADQWTDKIFTHLQDDYNCYCPSEADAPAGAPARPHQDYAPPGGPRKGPGGSVDGGTYQGQYDFIDSGEYLEASYPAAFETSVTDLPAPPAYHWVAQNSLPGPSTTQVAQNHTAVSAIGGGRIPASPGNDADPNPAPAPPTPPHHRAKAAGAQASGAQGDVMSSTAPPPPPPPGVQTTTTTTTTSVKVDEHGFLTGSGPAKGSGHSHLCDPTPPSLGWYEPNVGGICKDGGNIDPHACSIPDYQVSAGIRPAQVSTCQANLKRLKELFKREKQLNDEKNALEDRKLALKFEIEDGDDKDDSRKMEAGYGGSKMQMQAPKTNWWEVLAGAGLSIGGALLGSHSNDGYNSYCNNAISTAAKLGYSAGCAPAPSTFGPELAGLSAGIPLMTQGFGYPSMQQGVYGGGYSGRTGGIGCSGTVNGGGYQNGMNPMMSGFNPGGGAFGYPQGYGGNGFGYPNTVSGGAFMPGSLASLGGGSPFLNNGSRYGSPFGGGVGGYGGSPFGGGVGGYGGSPFTNGGLGAVGSPFTNSGLSPLGLSGGGGNGSNYAAQMISQQLSSVQMQEYMLSNQANGDINQINYLGQEQAALTAELAQLSYGSGYGLGNTSSYSPLGYNPMSYGSGGSGNGFNLSAGFNFGGGSGGGYGYNPLYYYPTTLNSSASGASGSPFGTSGSSVFGR